MYQHLENMGGVYCAECTPTCLGQPSLPSSSNAIGGCRVRFSPESISHGPFNIKHLKPRPIAIAYTAQPNDIPRHGIPSRRLRV